MDSDPFRRYFPHFEQHPESAYLDTAATAQKPAVVIETIDRLLRGKNANIHRGAYRLSADMTDAYEEARAIVHRWLGGSDDYCTVFTSGTTGGVNLLAHCFSQGLAAGDSILLTELEHHSNIVPWQLAAERRGLSIHAAKLLPDARVDFEDWQSRVRTVRPKVVSFSALSNAFGTLLPVREMVACAHEVGALAVVDCAQYAAHRAPPVVEWDADAIVFSGHKVYGPTGIGVLCAKTELLESLPPFLGGGDMIERVTIARSTWAEVPRRFEAGTPPFIEAVALGAAIAFLNGLDRALVESHEEELFRYGQAQLAAITGVRLIGGAEATQDRRAILSFMLDGVHPHDLATVLDSHDVQIRAGHHCAMPAHEALGLPATARASIGLYNRRADIDRLCEGLESARRIFTRQR